MRGAGLWLAVGLCLASCARWNGAAAQALVVDDKEGTGPPIGPSMTVTLRFTAARSDGGVITSNASSPDGFSLQVGKGFAMPGFERHVPGMRLNAVRRVTAPAASVFGKNLPPEVRADELVTLSLRVDDVIFVVEP